MAASTAETVSSRMQRWCPNGQAGGPWGEHGRHANPSTPNATSPDRSGPNPNSVTVGPNNDTTGVPIAVARCRGALSLVTSNVARPINAADWRSVKRPQAFTALDRP